LVTEASWNRFGDSVPFVVLFPLGHDDLSFGEHRSIICHGVAPTREPCRLARVDRHGLFGISRVIRMSLRRVLIEVHCNF
jgi:hypothetical protein